MYVGSPLHLTEVREAESRMVLFFLKTVTLTGRARRAPPEDRSSAHVGIVDCHKLYGGDLNRGDLRNMKKVAWYVYRARACFFLCL